MTVEGPAKRRVVPLAHGFAYVVQQSGPAQGYAVAHRSNIVQHRQRVSEIVFVTAAFNSLNSLKCREFRKDVRKQLSLVHKGESYGRPGRREHLVELFSYAFYGQDGQAVCHTANRFHRLGNDAESELGRAEFCGKTNGAQHTQRVVRIRGIRVQRSADDTVGKVLHTAERIYQSAEILFAEAQGHGVDCEVAPLLIVLQRAVLYYWFAGLAAV